MVSHPSYQRESKRGGASLISLIPLPLIKGKGIQGIGLPNKNLKWGWKPTKLA
jgi:hypothetical protein